MGETNHVGNDEQFPLEAYVAVYNWIGRWAEQTTDPELHAIARMADESLTAVGLIVLNTMRHMRKQDEQGPALDLIH